MDEIRRVGVIGAGTMGGGIAHVLALYGIDVLLNDVDEATLHRGLATIEHNMGRQVSKGTLTEEAKAEALGRIQIDSGLGAVSHVDLVIEAATERPELKYDLFRRLDQVVRNEAILASNTSSISITAIGAQTGRASRVVGMHFFNPVPMMKLVEVVRGLETDDATVEATMALATRLEKTPVVVHDAPGFVSNRVLMPMINEAAFCVQEGVAAPEDVDTVMKLGMAHPMGPLALADLIGIDVCVAILEVLQRDLGEDKYRPCPLLRKMAAAGHLGRKSGRGFFSYM